MQVTASVVGSYPSPPTTGSPSGCEALSPPPGTRRDLWRRHGRGARWSFADRPRRCGLLRRVLELIPAGRIQVDPDCGLKTRTVEKAKAKLRVIRQAIDVVKAEL